MVAEGSNHVSQSFMPPTCWESPNSTITIFSTFAKQFSLEDIIKFCYNYQPHWYINEWYTLWDIRWPLCIFTQPVCPHLQDINTILPSMILQSNFRVFILSELSLLSTMLSVIQWGPSCKWLCLKSTQNWLSLPVLPIIRKCSLATFVFLPNLVVTFLNPWTSFD